MALTHRILQLSMDERNGEQEQSGQCVAFFPLTEMNKLVYLHSVLNSMDPYATMQM